VLNPGADPVTTARCVAREASRSLLPLVARLQFVIPSGLPQKFGTAGVSALPPDVRRGLCPAVNGTGKAWPAPLVVRALPLFEGQIFEGYSPNRGRSPNPTKAFSGGAKPTPHIPAAKPKRQ
jgi:hypothetical protein